MAIRVSCHLRRLRVCRGAAERVVQAVLRELRYVRAEIGLTFVGDTAMRTLNRRYRRRDRPTDVLAFAGQEAWQPPADVPVLGDIVVSVPTAIRQANDAGHSLEHELTLLIVHGMLHLCGYDHERGNAEARRMFRAQRRILDRVMVPTRYFRSPSSMRRQEGYHGVA